MEEIAVLLLPAILSLLLIRALVLPLGFLFKTLIHSGFGLLCLWILNAVSPFTGILFPINAVTVLTAGFLGLPGITLMALAAILPGFS
ncbi:MAG: pro-sigmaK processing inhibitor BofA family protein [Oscillospiraceae bacterium]|nr:pro-sigmaK processing inhibitor BofA family protein [Oscillospiraceae bacterium]